MIIRLIIAAIVILVAAYFILQAGTIERSSEKPTFLVSDEIASEHHTKLDVTINSHFKPDSLELEILKKDYGNLWAHLNHLYSTNDITAGREYYTENWFRQLTKHFNGLQEPIILRTDISHKLSITNWSSDGLICTAADSVVLTHITPDNIKETVSNKFAVVLLLQGDHWRIDALKVLE